MLQLKTQKEISACTPLLVDVCGAASLLGISRPNFLSLCSSGRIGPTGTKLGRRRVFSVAELKAWVAADMPNREKWQELKKNGV